MCARDTRSFSTVANALWALVMVPWDRISVAEK
jgi:hypothetical protein